MDQIQCVWPRNLLVWASWLSNDNGIHFAGWRRLSPTTTRERLVADFMLAHRQQRWPNINPISGQLVTFAGISTGDVWTAELTDRDDSFLWPGDHLTMSMLIVPAEHQQSTSLPRDTHPMLGWCWASVGNAGPALTQHRTMYSVSKALARQWIHFPRRHVNGLASTWDCFSRDRLERHLLALLFSVSSLSRGAALKAVLKTTDHGLLRLVLSSEKLLYNIMWETLICFSWCVDRVNSG